MDLTKAKSILGIDGGFSLDDLKEKFRGLAKVFHPDLGGDSSKMSELLDAYRTLKNNITTAIIPFNGGKDNLPSVISGGINLPSVSEVGGAIKEVLGGAIIKTGTAAKEIIEIVREKVEEYQEYKEEQEAYKFDKNDMYEILNTLEETDDFRILKDINKKFLDDPYFMLMAIDIVPESIYYATKRLKSDPDFMIDVYDNNPELLYFADGSLKSNREFVIRALEIYTCSTLEFCDKSFRNDFTIMKRAVQIDGLAYKYASFELKSNIEIIKTALSQNSSVINMINPSIISSNKLYSEPEFILAAIKENNEAIVNKADDELWSNKDFVIKALKIRKDLVNKVDKKLFNDIDFVKEAMEIDTSLLAYMGSELKNNKEFAIYCVEKDGNSLKYFSGDIKANKNIVEKALDNNVDSFVYAAPGLALDEGYLSKIAKKYGMGANRPLYEEKKYMEMVIKANGIYAWEKAQSINPYAFDIDVLISLLRSSSTTEVELIYNSVKHQDQMKDTACGKVLDGDRITLNGEKKLQYKECKYCGARYWGNNDELSNLFDLEYHLAIRNYVDFDEKLVPYIIKRAREMQSIDFNILKYFPSTKTEDANYMLELASEFGIKAINYYTGEDRNTLARTCVTQYGIDSLKELNSSYLEDEGFIALMIRDYGEAVLDYINPNKIDIDKVKENINKLDELRSLAGKR